MATTKIWAIHTRLDHLVDYVCNPEKTANAVFDDLENVLEYAGDEWKTEQKYFVSGINCNPDTAYHAMSAALQKNQKPIKNLGYHGYQSFKGQEVTPDIAHEIGQKLATALWGDKFQVVVATHGNTGNIHNHFVLCSTSFIDGSRYHDCKESYLLMRKTSDKLCCDYGLSVIENPKPGKTKHYAQWQAEQLDKPTWRGMIKDDIDKAVSQSMTDKQFFHILREMGYDYKMTNKDISVRPRGKERFFRIKRNLGEEYSYEGICQRILKHRSVSKEAEPPRRKTILAIRLRGTKRGIKKVGGLRGLYLHYCYLLGIIPPKKHISPAQLHFVLREDLIKLDNIISETKLLAREGIKTSEQLFAFKEATKSQAKITGGQRKRLRADLKKTAEPNEQATLKRQIAELSKSLKRLNAQQVLCDNIAARSDSIAEKIEMTKSDKKEKNYEQRKRERNERAGE